MRQTTFRRYLHLGSSLAAGLAAVALAAGQAPAQEPATHHHQPGMPTTSTDGAGVPLYDNLGTLGHKVTTASAKAQKYFDQGLRLTYAFNHDEAIASYTAATREDSTCAMCWWGIAYAMGPNINAPMDTAVSRPAYAAIQRALKLAPNATAYERDMLARLSCLTISQRTDDAHTTLCHCLRFAHYNLIPNTRGDCDETLTLTSGDIKSVHRV
jgi:hypothetical protein